MNISPIYIQSKLYQNRPSFGSNAVGKGTSEKNPSLHQNFTHFFRYDYDMDTHIDNIIRLQNKYNNNLNLTICGCSDGTKAIEQQMALIKGFKKRGISLDKLPKIRAFDINKDMIEIAKKGRINISDREYDWIQSTYPETEFHFWKDKRKLVDIPNNDIEFIEKSLNTNYRCSYQYNEDLLDKIEFYQGDIFEELPKLKSKTPQIISCENIAIYFDDDYKQKKLADILSDSLSPESYVIVGQRDANYIPEYNIPNTFVKSLRQKGFSSNFLNTNSILEKLTYDPQTGFYYSSRGK